MIKFIALKVNLNAFQKDENGANLTETLFWNLAIKEAIKSSFAVHLDNITVNISGLLINFNGLQIHQKDLLVNRNQRKRPPGQFQWLFVHPQNIQVLKKNLKT